MLQAIIFDLDGVITDTAEYHFLAWKRLADEEGISFTRADNEKLRGVSRRESLELLLAGRQISEQDAVEWMARKNSHYQEMIKTLGPKNLLPGVSALLTELRNKGFKVAVASASRNAPEVIKRLCIEAQLDGCADGNSVEHQKPAPDLFLFTAQLLQVPPAECLVVEDAASGIQAAKSAGMLVVGLGPQERVGEADAVFPNLEGVTAADLTRGSTWRVVEASFQHDRQHHRETIFTQGNGYLGTRGSLEEGFPDDRGATFIHGLWDDVTVGVTELVNCPDWTALEVWINGERFSMDQGIVEHYARHLDLRNGVLSRRLRWIPGEGGGKFDLTFERFPSLADPHVMGARVQVQAMTTPAVIEIRSSLNMQVDNEGRQHWKPVSQQSQHHTASLEISTLTSGKTLAMSCHLHTYRGATKAADWVSEGSPGEILSAELKKGESLVVDKFVTAYSSRDHENPLEASEEKVKEASSAGYERLREENNSAWREFWTKSDVIIEGDQEAQLSIRHALFQLRIAASSTDERVSIGAKTMSGFGYRGHVFWDNEIFVLPFFTHTQPALARNMLMYRWHTIGGARRKAAENDFPGAQYAWESAETGDEATPRWLPDGQDPTKMVRIWTGDIQLHITADIAYAIWQYWQATGDDDFMMNFGAPIILETAVFWASRVEPINDHYTIRQVMGPDEYHAHVDNNAFTNGMVRRHLEVAIDLHDWLAQVAPRKAEVLDRRLEISPDNLDDWRDIANNLAFRHDQRNGIIEQFDGFFELEDVDWGNFVDRTESMQALLGIEEINRYQVLKQADVIMLLCLLRDQFDRKTWRANWVYYNKRTDHSYGSSLSPAIHAWAACELGQPELAYEHFMRAARADLKDVRGNAGDGIHAASAGGLWQAVVFGFAGLRLTDDGYELRSKLPSHWDRLAFNFFHQGKWHQVDLTAEG
jgi:kojibiose phosphorylase